MKNYVLFLSIILNSSILFSQMPNNTVYSGGLVIESYQPTFYSGNHIYQMGSWDIDSILDTGTPVILDVFATWCGPCWTFHNSHKLNDFYDSKGWSGTGEVAIFAIESSQSTAPAELQDPTKDWINNTKYPVANYNSALAYLYSSYYPTIAMICPDRTITYFGGHSTINQSVLNQALLNCGGVSTFQNDPRILFNETVDKLEICGTTTDTLDLNIVIQNYGSNPMNANYTLKVYNGNNNLVLTTIKHLNLTQYEVEEVSLGGVLVNDGTNTFTVVIANPNDDLTNDSLEISVDVTQAVDFVVGPSKEIDLSIEIDMWGEELGIVFNEGIPTSFDPFDQYSVHSVNNAIFYEPLGNTGSVYHDLFLFDTTLLVNDYGCHYFVFYDSSNDGIAMSAGNNHIYIESVESANIISISGDFQSGVVILLNVQEMLSLEEPAHSNSLTAYPNPNFGNFYIGTQSVKNINSIKLFDLSGAEIKFSKQIFDNRISVTTEYKGVAIVVVGAENGTYHTKVLIE